MTRGRHARPLVGRPVKRRVVETGLFSPADWERCFTQLGALLGQPVTPGQQKGLVDFCAHLQQWNRVHNLIGPAAQRELLDRHILDSAQLLPFLGAAVRIADMGSGGGFPGLVLAILSHPPRRIGLIESAGKKSRFLAHVIRALELDDRACLLPMRAERVGELEKSAYDLVVSRALGRFAMTAALAWPLLRPGGAYLAIKGRQVQKELAEWARHPKNSGFWAPVIHRPAAAGDGVIVRLEKKVSCETMEETWGGL